MKKKKKKLDWESLSDEELLQMKIRNLGLTIHGSPLEPMIKNLYGELDDKGIKFHPPSYLADEWLCPDRQPIMGIPFVLAHQRLRNLEQKMMFEVEGASEDSCMKLLRHETGHVLNYAYKLYRKTRWRQLFGSFNSRYSNSYYYQPYSKRFVVNLEDNYAQAHPDEDFAETFAVWLNPRIAWQKKYNGWPVIKKLRYIDTLFKKIPDKPLVMIGQQKPPWAASRMTSTLSAYYERKRRLLGEDFKGFYDDALVKLFSQKHTKPPWEKASKILRKNRLQLVNNISKGSGHRKYDIHQLINKLIYRCDALNLYAEKKDIIGPATLIASIAGNTLRLPKGKAH
jgi:hypothetical protein